MRVNSVVVARIVALATVAMVVLSACNLREGDGREYGHSSGGYVASTAMGG